jgi:Ser/Thr protein kinase RdoA (MazF antagonist)
MSGMQLTDASYSNLSPDEILNVIDRSGYRCDGRILALNSYENRVYQVGIEDEKPIIAKFYRPGRWSDEAILEEHRFTLALAGNEIPVIAPLEDTDGNTLLHVDGYRFALYLRVGGRTPELDNPDHLLQLGRTLARIHNLGELEPFQHRPDLTIQSFGVEPSRFVLAHDFIPADLRESYRTLIEDLLPRIERCFKQAGKVRRLRLHGDCHLGNVLWNNDAPFIVDFDDARMGPAVQDLWMMLSGDREYMTARLFDLLEGYCEFRPFDPRELKLIEALRTLRMIHYAGWIATRWEDPAFPLAFPWFNTQRYWQDHILSLREQAAIMDEPPLDWEPE